MSTDKPHDRCLTTSSSSGASVSVRWIGQPALDALSGEKKFTVRGVTSRGIFLETDDAWIVFLSKESYRGPLTLNITNYKNIPWVEPGQKGCIDSGIISFDIVELAINYLNAEPWRTFGRIMVDLSTNSMAIRNNRVASFVDLLRQTRESPNEYLDAALLFFFSAEFPDISDLSPRLDHLIRAFITGNLTPASNAITFIVGRGIGLTPSGDDFLAGLLYSLALCRQYDDTAGSFFRDSIVNAIRTRSTLISANLAQCAAAGEVDERIFDAVDYLINGKSSEATAVEGIRNWGSSSGTDSIAGFLIGLKAVELRSSKL